MTAVGVGLSTGCATPVDVPSMAAASATPPATAAPNAHTVIANAAGGSMAPFAVTLDGNVVGSDGSPKPGAGVFRVALDPYLEPVVQTQTDPAGAFSLAGATGGTREWLLVQLAGSASLYQAFDTGTDSRQSLGPVTLFTDADLTALARSVGAQFDASRSVVRVPVVAAAANGVAPVPAEEIQVTFTPPLGTPAATIDGAALAFDALPNSEYSIAIARNGAPCAPQAHPEIVTPDGSMPIGTIAGGLTVTPVILCPSVP
ncbi:MAG TPA: hypothetical protein VHV30_10330 [Polyangiaceae bacterium]|nr:hypothetical protein [Polyangiaceae bacterium]